MSTKVQIVSQQVPSSFCPISNDDWQSLVALLSGTFTGDPNLNSGSTTPPPANRGKPWFHFNTDGTPDRWYVFAQGAWLSSHPMATGLISIYTGAEADLDTFDGGEAGAITTISGPMWQKVAALNAKMPIGIGTLESATVIGVGDTGGEENHTLLTAEMAKHRHLIAATEGVNNGLVTTGLNGSNFTAYGGFLLPNGDSYLLQASGQEPTVGLTSQTGADTPHNNLPPYYGVLFIARTARKFYRINA